VECTDEALLVNILKTWQFDWQPGNATGISLFATTATSINLLIRR
jgi:hypothetical protein